MRSELVINVTSREKRVALLEYGNLAEFYVERDSDRSLVGSIYKGQVLKILPGMQACFVDIGMPRAAFLYVSDVRGSSREYGELLGLEEDIDYRDDNGVDLEVGPANTIEDLLTEGQEVLLQVAKDPIGTKGARVTTDISLPGRNLVLLPLEQRVGISRRIRQERERQRLRELIQRLRPGSIGFIARTASEGVEEDELLAEMSFLIQLWEVIRQGADRGPIPRLLYTDLDFTLRAVRDLMVGDVDRLVIDSHGEYQKILGFLESYMPQHRNRVQLYGEEEPIFDACHIETEIARALERKIWLKSGGYILIEETEALTSIDVNTGRYVGGHNLEETILKINLEAAKEIAYQLRLRNIGGIIIIDFIDMDRESSRERVFQTLKDAVQRDRSRTNILEISELGLLEMTRKRVKEGIGRQLCESCSSCDGQGWIRSATTLCYDALREIQREVAHSMSLKGDVLVEVHPEVANVMFEEERNGLEELENRLNRRIVVKTNDSLYREKVEVWIE
jgi:ribonuclease G